MNRTAITIVLGLSVGLLGCERKPSVPAGGSSATTQPAAPPNGESHHHEVGAEHGHDPAAEGEADRNAGHGPAIELGIAKIGEFDVRAARDMGDIKPGGDAPIDVWVSGGSAKVVAVRFWIGTQDAKGSIKAKAEIEDPAQPNHWHTHTEIPDPLPAGSKLWVAIETDRGASLTGSFGLAL